MPVRVCDDDPNHIGEYTLEERLGDGTYGTVFVATHAKKKERFAVKRIDFNLHPEQLRATEKQVAREATIMQGLQHAHVVKLIKVMQGSGAFYFVMELAEGGELLDKMADGAFDETTSRRYFQELISAIHYCHGKNVVHRDLKAENLLLTKGGVLKVCDFGFSCHLFDNPDYDDDMAETRSDCSMGNAMEGSTMFNHGSSGALEGHPYCSNFPAPSMPPSTSGPAPSTGSGQHDCNDTTGLSETTSTHHDDNGFMGFNDEVGTVGYMPPEMLRSCGFQSGHHKEDKVDPRTHDLWAAGVILYFMLTGSHPFEGHDEEETVFNIIKNKVDFSLIAEEGPRKLVEDMLAPEPQARLSLQDIIDTAWFQQDLDDSLFPESFLAGVKKRQNCRSFLEFKRSPSSSALHVPLTPATTTGSDPIASRPSITSVPGSAGSLTPVAMKSNRNSFADMGSHHQWSHAGITNGLGSRSTSMADVNSLLTIGGHSIHHHGSSSSHHHHNNHHHNNNNHHHNNNHHNQHRASRTPSGCAGSITPTMEEQRVIRRAFDAIDIDGYGDFITWAQLRDMLILLKGKQCMTTAAPTTPSSQHTVTSSSVTPVDISLPPFAQPPSFAGSDHGGGAVISEGTRWLLQLLDLFEGDTHGVITHEEFSRAWTDRSLANGLPKGLESFRLRVIAESRSPGFVPPKTGGGAQGKHAPSSGSAAKSPTSPLPPGLLSKLPIEFSSSGAGSVDSRTRKSSSFVSSKPISPLGVATKVNNDNPLSSASTSSTTIFATATNTKHLSQPVHTTSSSRPGSTFAASVSPVSSPTTSAPAVNGAHNPFPDIPSVDDLTATVTSTFSECPTGERTMPPSVQPSAMFMASSTESGSKKPHSPNLIASTCATAGCTPVDTGFWGCGRSTPPLPMCTNHLGNSPLSRDSPSSFQPIRAVLPDLESLGLSPQHLSDGDGRAQVRVLRRVFDLLDDDGDGLVFSTGLERMFQEAGMTDVTPDEVRHLVQHLDGSSKSGCFTFGEFVHGTIRRSFMVSHPLGKKFAQASGLGKYFGMCSGSKGGNTELATVATAKFTVVGIPSDVFERISTFSPERLRLRPHHTHGTFPHSHHGSVFPSFPQQHHHHHSLGDTIHSDPFLSPSAGGSPLSNSVTPFSLSGSHRGLPTPRTSITQEPFVATFQFTRGQSPHHLAQVISHHSSPTTGSSPHNPTPPHTGMESPDRLPHTVSTSPFEIRSREGSFRVNSIPGSAQRRFDNCTLYSTASPEPSINGHMHPGLGSARINSPLPCEVSIHIHNASHSGYTAVRMSQKSGSTKDFQEAVEVIAQSLESMRDQAVHDSCTRGDSELL